jgi:hypothetical protein
VSAPGLLLLLAPHHAAFASCLAALARAGGWHVAVPPLSERALADDRAAVTELSAARDAIVHGGADPARLALAGCERGGTLAFLCACAWRVRATVDVEGPFVHAALTRERPIQPLELALNFEGALLVVRAPASALSDEELAHLEARLSSAGRPCAIVVAPELALTDPAERARALAGRVFSYLLENCAAEPD